MITHSLAVSFLFPHFILLSNDYSPLFPPEKRVIPPPKKKFSIPPQAINRDWSLRKHQESITSIVQVPVEYFSVSSLVAKTKDSFYVKERNKFERSFQILTHYGAKTETDRQIKEECLSVL